MIWGQSLAELFEKTGFTRWPLLLCSVVGLTIVLERLYYFYRLRLDYAQFSRELLKLLRESQLPQAIHLCQGKANPIPHLATVYLANLENKQRDSILTREGSMAMEKVESRLRGLATITHVAPLLGLLGTVVGLVIAFQNIELAAGDVRAEQLAGGIWEALLSTVFGLIVAIPCMVAYHGFESLADRIARRMQSIVSELDEFFGTRTHPHFQATHPEATNESMNMAR